MAGIPDHDHAPQHVLNHLFRWQFASSIYLSLLQVACLVFLGQFLGYKEMGIFTIFQLIFRFANALFDPGMFVSLIQKTGINQLIITKERRIQTFIVFVGIILLLGFYFWEHHYLNTYPIIALVSLLVFITIGIGSYYPAVLLHHLKQKQISLFQMIAGSLEFILILIAIWYLDPVLVFSLGLLLRFVVFYISCWLYSRCIPLIEDSNQSLHEHLSFSSFQVVNQGISFFQGNFDTVFIGSVFGLMTLGPYNLASEFSYLLFSKINPVFNKAIFPLLAKYQSDVKNRQNIIYESLLSHALVCITVYLLLYAHLGDLVPLIFKDPESKILLFSRYIVIMAMIRSVNNIIFNQLLALGESGRLLRWNITVLIINYSFIAIVFLTNTAINHFLLINIFLSFTVLIYTSHRLLGYYQDSSLFYNPLIKYAGFLVSCLIYLYFISIFGLPFFISLACSLSGMFGLIFAFYRIKISDLLQFKIM